MATIADLAEKDTRAGSNRSWRAVTDRFDDGPSGRWRHIFHYSTKMLSYYCDDDGKWDGNLDTVYVSTGKGSKSDQGGMNQLFSALGMPLYFTRTGGAQIIHSTVGKRGYYEEFAR